MSKEQIIILAIESQSGLPCECMACSAVFQPEGAVAVVCVETNDEARMTRNAIAHLCDDCIERGAEFLSGLWAHRAEQLRAKLSLMEKLSALDITRIASKQEIEEMRAIVKEIQNIKRGK